MTTITTEAQITGDRMLKLELPCDLDPGPVRVVVLVEPCGKDLPRKWDSLYGLGREVWKGVDPRMYVQDLRQDRECTR